MRSLAVVLLLAVSCSAQSFDKADYAVGSNPMGVVSADFNHDGVADVAVANHGNGTVSILLGRGDGSFGGSSSVAAGASPTELVSADFNSDGIADLAVASSPVAILLGNGDGTFRRGDVSFTATSITDGDFNGDGSTDVALVSQGNVQILLNSGNGSFRTGVTITPAVPAAVVRALNQNGRVDLAIGSCCQGSDVTYGAFFLATGNGDGTFNVQKLFDQPDGTKLTVADVTRDGRPDFVIPYVGCHTPCMGIEVDVNNGGSISRSGGGMELGDLVYVAPGQASVADFNLDGVPEVAAPFAPGDYTTSPGGSGLDKVVIWSVGSDGKFSNQRDYALGSAYGGYGTAVGDFNHDGRPDLAVTDYRIGKVTILLNNNDGAADFALHVQFSPQTVKAGDKAQYEYLLEALNGSLPQVQLTCSGLPTGAACDFQNSMTGPVTQGWLNISTTPRTSAALHMQRLMTFAMMLPFGFVALPGNRRKKALAIAVLLVAIAMILQTGCAGGVKGGNAVLANGASQGSNGGNTAGSTGTTGGNGGTTTGTTTGGGSGAPPASGPTPAGSYQVTVTATGGGISHSQVITLIVQ